jgi:hypothetical protein
MQRTPTWHASPRARRTIAELTTALSENSSVALMVGSGVDSGLRGRPIWSELIDQLARRGGIHPSGAGALARVASKWPVEAAEALRGAIGSRKYNEAIKAFVAHRAAEHPPLANALRTLVRRGVRVIVSFNYTSDLVDALHARKGIRVRVIQREDLSAWNPQQLLSPPENHVHLIALHGYVDHHSNQDPNFLLGRRSYDDAVLHTPYYNELLKRLFQDFTVLTLGLSWSDVPLRNAAAQLLLEFPIAAKVHAAVLSHGSYPEDVWQERGFVNSYSVRPLFYDAPGNQHHQAASVLCTVARDVTPAPSLGSRASDAELNALADMLEQWGDYESGPQCDWMAEHWASLANAVLERQLKEIDSATWLALAHIERHLRHFVWFYLPQASRVEFRRRLWEQVALLRAHIPGAPPLNSVGFLTSLATEVTTDGNSSRGYFEFAIGAFEVQYEGAAGAPSRVMRGWQKALRYFARVHPTSILAERVAIARQLWRVGKKPGIRQLKRLRQQAVACEWEGIEAKIALDVAQQTFAEAKALQPDECPRKWREKERSAVLTAAEDARIAARTAGCLRREVGSVVVGSFVAPIASAESTLLAIYQRFNTGNRRVELSMLWWIYTGLLAVFADTREERRATRNEALRWLTRRCGQLQPTKGHMLRAVAENSIPHWKFFHAKAGELAEELMAIS